MEMHAHTSKIQAHIGSGENDKAWRLAHEYQGWCFERINLEKYDLVSAGTILSSVQGFLFKILAAEKKYHQALGHKIYEGVLDGRNLKAYSKSIKTTCNRCKFSRTQNEEVLGYYEKLKAGPPGIKQDFKQIQAQVSKWG